MPDKAWQEYAAGQASPAVGRVELNEAGMPVAQDDETTKALQELHAQVQQSIAARARPVAPPDLSDPEAPRG